MNTSLPLLYQRLDDCGDSCVSKSRSRGQIDKGAELEELLVRMDFRAGGSDDCHNDVLRSSFKNRLSRGSQHLNARKAVEAVENSEREKFFQRAIFSALHMHIADVDETKLSGRRFCHGLQASTVLVLFRSQRLHQIILMLLQNRAEKIFHFVQLKDGKENFSRSYLLGPKG